MLYIYIFITLTIIFILILFFKYRIVIPVVSIVLSSIERLSLYIGFTVTPIFLISIPSILIAYSNLNIKNIIKQNKNLFIITLFPFIGAFISFIFSDNKIISLKSSLYVLIYCLLIGSEFIILKVYYKNRTKILFLSIFITQLIFSIYGILQFFRFLFGFYPDIFNINIPLNNTLDPSVFITHSFGKIFLRPNSLFSEINTSAGFIFLYIPFTLSFIYLYFKKRIKIINIYIILITSLLSILYLIFANSRSIYIGGVFSGIIFFIVLAFIKFKLKYKYITMIIFLLFFLLFILNFNFIETKINLYFRNDYSSTVHLDAVNSDIRMFKKYPITGGGIGTFPNFFNNEIKLGRLQDYSTVTNPPLYLKILAEEGIIGFLLNIIFFLYLYIYTFKNIILLDKTGKIIILSLLMGFSSILIANFFHSYVELYFTAIFIGIYLGLIELLKQN